MSQGEKDLTFPKGNMDLERMWIGHLECSISALQLFEDLWKYGIQKPAEGDDNLRDHA